jgi:hypothetical protein
MKNQEGLGRKRSRYISRYYVRGSFEKFVDSPYYPESEFCGGALTVTFSNKVSPRSFQASLVVAPPS